MPSVEFTLASTLTAPFYAYRNTPFNLGALGGLKINRKCEVLTVEGEVIPGLYAAGLNAGGWGLEGIPGPGVGGAVGRVHLGVHAAAVQ